MAKIDRIRTTAFRLPPEHLGRVHIYRAGGRFIDAWDRLGRSWAPARGSDMGALPYKGLATALRVLSGDFVALQRNVGRQTAFIISRRAIEMSDLTTAVRAWEVYALERDDCPVSGHLDDLARTELDVADRIEFCPGRCPVIPDGERWVWDVAIWEAAHRLASARLVVDSGELDLRLDSDAALFTWDGAIRAKRDGRAMHKIKLHLMTVPGVDAPIISLQSSLVRLAPTWKATGGARYAWADLGPGSPLLRASVRNRLGNNQWETLWDDRATEVLKGASLTALPSLAGEPTLDGNLRTGYVKQPKSHSIGRGVGPCFHEYVARHALSVLRGVVPLELEAIKGVWPTDKTIALREPRLSAPSSVPSIEIAVVYETSRVRHRVVEAVRHVLRDNAHVADDELLIALAAQIRELPDGEILRCGPLSVRFLKPAGAEMLLQRSPPEKICRWVDSWLDTQTSINAALIETDETLRSTKQDGLADPKPILRAALAQRGIVTQFITDSSTPKKWTGNEEKYSDYPAGNAFSDLIRSTGWFLRPFPSFRGERGTHVIGVYATFASAKTTKKTGAYLVNIVATSLGTTEAWGYTDGHGWQPLGQATASFLASDHVLDKDEAKHLVQRAIGQHNVAFGGKLSILLFDASGCRRFWPCLADKSDTVPEPWMTAAGNAVVRVRSETAEVPRAAGTGGWEPPARPAKFTPFRPMRIAGAGAAAARFVLSGSATMSQDRALRGHTRLTAKERDLENDWHSLAATEILVMDPGTWNADDVVAQVAMMCRVAPTWDRTLRWPSPLHLARAVVSDHPHSYYAGDQDEADDNKPQGRFDFGFQ